MKTTQASTTLEIWVTCPYCNEYQERLDDLREHLDTDELRAEECDVELRCKNKNCLETFKVDEIEF